MMILSLCPVSSFVTTELTGGDYFGELAIVKGCKRAASIMAKTAVTCACITKDELLHITGRLLGAAVPRDIILTPWHETRYVPMQVHACIHTYTLIYMPAYIHTCTHLYAHTSIDAFIHTCIHIYIHIIPAYIYYMYNKHTAVHLICERLAAPLLRLPLSSHHRPPVARHQ